MGKPVSTNTGKADMDSAEAPELSRLPPEFVRSLTSEQRALLLQSLPGRAWRRHPVDLRFSIPWFGRGLFVTVVAGTERRSPKRRSADRERYPLHRVGNLLFLCGLAALLYALVITGAVLAGATL